VALHRSVPPTTDLETRRNPGLKPIRLAAASLLAACLALGAVASDAQTTFSPVAAASYGIISPNDGGPCWGCGG
jgi:hypothetical protein